MSNAYKSFTEPEVERQVLNHISTLSCTSISDARLAFVRAGLMQEDFAVPLHRSIFNVVGNLVLNKGNAVDPFAVKAELERTQGDPLDSDEWMATAEITGGVGVLTASSYDSHCRILRDLAVRRLAVGQLDAAAAMARDRTMDPNVVIAQVTSKLAAIAGAGSNVQSLRQVMDDLNQRYEQVQSGTITPIVKTGIHGLDKIIGGWQPTLNLVAALPGVGKSALFATTIQAIAQRGEKVGLISLEDEAAWLGYRLWSHESDVDQFLLRFEKTKDREHNRLADGFLKMNKYWDNVIIADGSDSAHRIESVVGIAQSLILNHKCKVVLVDHLGEVTRGSDERYDLEVADNLSAMRRVANAHQVPMVVAMHLKRRDGLGPGDEPRLSDFANSAGAERKARVAVGLSREPESDTLTYYVLKNTNGKAGMKGDVHFTGAAAMLSTVEPTGHVMVRKPAASTKPAVVPTERTGEDVPGLSEVKKQAGKFDGWFLGEGFKKEDDDA